MNNSYSAKDGSFSFVRNDEVSGNIRINRFIIKYLDYNIFSEYYCNRSRIFVLGSPYISEENYDTYRLAIIKNKIQFPIALYERAEIFYKQFFENTKISSQISDGKIFDFLKDFITSIEEELLFQ